GSSEALCVRYGPTPDRRYALAKDAETGIAEVPREPERQRQLLVFHEGLRGHRGPRFVESNDFLGAHAVELRRVHSGKTEGEDLRDGEPEIDALRDEGFFGHSGHVRKIGTANPFSIPF